MLYPAELRDLVLRCEATCPSVVERRRKLRDPLQKGFYRLSGCKYNNESRPTKLKYAVLLLNLYGQSTERYHNMQDNQDYKRRCDDVPNRVTRFISNSFLFTDRTKGQSCQLFLRRSGVVHAYNNGDCVVHGKDRSANHEPPHIYTR